jgi:hypothetical protein
MNEEDDPCDDWSSLDRDLFKHIKREDDDDDKEDKAKQTVKDT